MKRKAQAAMEFLMTYGWAILVVLVAIGALAYFGVLSPDRFLPEKCTGSSGFECLDKPAIDAEADTVTFVFTNNQGYTIELYDTNDVNVDSYELYLESDQCTGGLAVNTIVVTDISGTAFSAGTTANTLSIPNNQRVKVVATCAGIAEGRFKGTLHIGYRNTETLLDHGAQIELTGRAE
jgi:hypothetical protein